MGKSNKSARTAVESLVGNLSCYPSFVSELDNDFKRAKRSEIDCDRKLDGKLILLSICRHAGGKRFEKKKQREIDYGRKLGRKFILVYIGRR